MNHSSDSGPVPGSRALAKQILDTTGRLWRDTHLKMNEGARLREQNALIRTNLLEALTRSRTSRREVQFNVLKQQGDARVVLFPENEFTLQELEHINPTLDPSLVRARLAYAIRSRRVEFFERNGKSYGGFKRISYRLKTGAGKLDGE